MKVVINFDKKYVYGIFTLIVLVIGVVGVYAGVDKTKPYHNASQIEMANGQSLQEVMDEMHTGGNIIGININGNVIYGGSDVISSTNCLKGVYIASNALHSAGETSSESGFYCVSVGTAGAYTHHETATLYLGHNYVSNHNPSYWTHSGDNLKCGEKTWYNNYWWWKTDEFVKQVQTYYNTKTINGKKGDWNISSYGYDNSGKFSTGKCTSADSTANALISHASMPGVLKIVLERDNYY